MDPRGRAPTAAGQASSGWPPTWMRQADGLAAPARVPRPVQQQHHHQWLQEPGPPSCVPCPALACVSRVFTIGSAMEGMTSKALVTRPRDTSTPVLALRHTGRVAVRGAAHLHRNEMQRARMLVRRQAAGAGWRGAGEAGCQLSKAGGTAGAARAAGAPHDAQAVGDAGRHRPLAACGSSRWAGRCSASLDCLPAAPQHAQSREPPSAQQQGRFLPTPASPASRAALEAARPAQGRRHPGRRKQLHRVGCRKQPLSASWRTLVVEHLRYDQVVVRRKVALRANQVDAAGARKQLRGGAGGRRRGAWGTHPTWAALARLHGAAWRPGPTAQALPRNAGPPGNQHGNTAAQAPPHLWPVHGSDQGGALPGGAAVVAAVNQLHGGFLCHSPRHRPAGAQRGCQVSRWACNGWGCTAGRGLALRPACA